MAEGATGPADSRSPTSKLDSGPRSFAGVIMVVLLALVPPLVGYITGPGGAFFTALVYGFLFGRPLIELLRQAFPTPQIAYWATPLLTFGRLGELP